MYSGISLNGEVVLIVFGGVDKAVVKVRSATKDLAEGVCSEIGKGQWNFIKLYI